MLDGNPVFYTTFILYVLCNYVSCGPIFSKVIKAFFFSFLYSITCRQIYEIYNKNMKIVKNISESYCYIKAFFFFLFYYMQGKFMKVPIKKKENCFEYMWIILLYGSDWSYKIPQSDELYTWKLINILSTCTWVKFTL